MQNPFFDFYRTSLESYLRLQQLQIEFWSRFWSQQATRTPEDVARMAAKQVSRAAGSVSESAEAANQEQQRRERKSA